MLLNTTMLRIKSDDRMQNTNRRSYELVNDGCHRGWDSSRLFKNWLVPGAFSKQTLLPGHF